MRKVIVHLSDLHFGALHPEHLNTLRAFLQNLAQLDLVILTGDLTQRARSSQFAQAAEFLKELKAPCLVVPGNHDVSLTNPFKRWFGGPQRFTQWLSTRGISEYQDEVLSVVGISTVNLMAPIKGKISQSELTRIEKLWGEQNPAKFRILACHHPITDSKAIRAKDIKERLPRLLHLKPHMILSGHNHQRAFYQYQSVGHPSTYLLSAGTALSHRTRTEGNSFNVIELDQDLVTIRMFEALETGPFQAKEVHTFRTLHP